MTRIYKCNHCGIEETDENRLQKCTGCNSSKKLYCSRECQKLDWPSHKNRCRRKANDADTLVVRDRKVLDIDRVLIYASRYMMNLKNVNIQLTEYYKVGIGKTVMSSDILQTFLKSNSGQLDGFALHWMMGVLDEQSIKTSLLECTTITNEGKVLLELNDLKALQLTCPIFLNCSDLVKVINQQQNSIISLALVNMCLYGLGAPWTRNDCGTITRSISKCKHLIRLNLNQHYLRDSDIETMIPCLPNLRILLLSGTIGKKGGHLTDKSCKIISKSCKQLREIDLAYQHNTTITGIKRVLKSCQHIRMLQTSLKLSPKDTITLIEMAPNLLFLLTGSVFDDTTYSDIAEATQGRVVTGISRDTYGLRVVKGLSEEMEKLHNEKMKIFLEYTRNLDKQTVYNDWAFLD